jgi:hypothetical protein
VVSFLTEMERKIGEHTFSIEMKSKNTLNHISLSDRSIEPVLIQGELGRLEGVYLLENATLEVRGVKGTLRLDISKEEFEIFLSEQEEKGEKDSEC